MYVVMFGALPEALTHPTFIMVRSPDLIVRSPPIVECEVRNAIALSILTKNAIVVLVVRSPPIVDWVEKRNPTNRPLS
jgi:hypothetical protein